MADKETPEAKPTLSPDMARLVLNKLFTPDYHWPGDQIMAQQQLFMELKDILGEAEKDGIRRAHEHLRRMEAEEKARRGETDDAADEDLVQKKREIAARQKQEWEPDADQAAGMDAALEADAQKGGPQKATKKAAK